MVVVFPHPVSPTSPTFSPWRTERFTPSSTLSDAAVDREVHREVPDIEHEAEARPWTCQACSEANMSRMPSPRRLKPMTTTTMARAGKTAIHHWSGR